MRLKQPFLWALIAVLAAACSSESEAPAPKPAADPAPSTPAPQAADPAAPAASTDVASGKKIYEQYCFSCHNPGLNDAPKLGDTEAWAPRIAKGPDLLLQATIEGIPPAMPPRGICMSCSDEQLSAAIAYMTSVSQ